MRILRTLRKEHNITQTKLAKVLGVSRSAVSMWEIDASEPDNEMLKKIASFFDVSTDLLLGQNEQKEKPATDGDGISPERRKLIDLLMKLTPDDAARAEGYLQSLIDAHKQ